MRILFRSLAVWLLLVFILVPSLSVHAGPTAWSARQVNVYDLIDAVNGLRLAHGLTPYAVSPILMFTAQN